MSGVINPAIDDAELDTLELLLDELELVDDTELDEIELLLDEVNEVLLELLLDDMDEMLELVFELELIKLLDELTDSELDTELDTARLDDKPTELCWLDCAVEEFAEPFEDDPPQPARVIIRMSRRFVLRLESFIGVCLSQYRMDLLGLLQALKT
jgi:hypothetical protein